MPFKKGQVSNPKGRTRAASIPLMVKRLAAAKGADRWLAAAILTAVETGALNLKHVDVGSGLEVKGYSITEFPDYLKLVQYIWPAFKDIAQDDEASRPASITVELGKTGTDG